MPEGQFNLKYQGKKKVRKGDGTEFELDVFMCQVTKDQINVYSDDLIQAKIDKLKEDDKIIGRMVVNEFNKKVSYILKDFKPNQGVI